MAKQDRYANQAAKQIVVAGRKLRTSDPDFVRLIVDVIERRLERGEDLPEYSGKGGGAGWAAARLKGLA